MKNPFHSQGSELDKESQVENHQRKFQSEIKEYQQLLDKKYGNSIPAKIWKAILLSLKKIELSNSSEQHRKNYMKA